VLKDFKSTHRAPTMTNPTACIILIGNEILSGRTQDKNLSWLALELGAMGIDVRRAMVIPDDAATIIQTVKAVNTQHNYVFTTGGIGPTHDDITTACVAEAFGVQVIRHAEAERILREHYQHDESKLNAARLKMADIPEGATLIDNPVSAAPGFRLQNVFVMAGVPSIMQDMFLHIKQMLKGGAPTQSRQVELIIGEGSIAAEIEAVQRQFPDVAIGVYPTMKEGRARTTIVARSTDATVLDSVMAACDTFIEAQRIERSKITLFGENVSHSP
jgi:molybdenum cofactor synthesis domain-containing protein